VSDQSGGGGSPAPGWYPDPSDPGQQRWWDGSQWTEQTMPTVGSSQPAAQASTWGQVTPTGGGMATGGVPPRIDTWLWQSIVATLLCCLPVGVVAIVFSAQSQSAMNVGNYAEAQAKANTAKTLTLVAVGVGLVGVVGWLFFVFVVGAAGF
jgi:hypothetical protein